MGDGFGCAGGFSLLWIGGNVEMGWNVYWCFLNIDELSCFVNLMFTVMFRNFEVPGNICLVFLVNFH